jgi:nucleoside-diphosphate-sugar epimerase
MKVFIAGGSGVIGRRLVPLLVARGYEVAAMSRSHDKARELSELGAEPILADGLDRAAVLRAVARARPEVVIHQMTSLAGIKSLKKFDDELVLTNRLRTEGTDYLLEAARAVGARRLIAQSYGLWGATSGGGGTKGAGLDSDVPATMRRTYDAIRHVESAVPQAEGIEGLVLRYGFFYGPSTGIAADGELVELIRKRRRPLIGNGAGVWSFVHIDDAATATLAAIERGAPGVHNVVDDEPAPLRVWLPELAEALQGKPPRHVSEWIGRLAAGEAVVYLATRIQGLSNAETKRELGWRLHYPSWREGFRRGLAEAPVETARAA